MAERSLRGTNLSALSMETDENVVLSERRISTYVCPDGHISELPFSVEADIPPIWECRCGQEAKLVDGPEPDAKTTKPVRTHWDMLLERRDEKDLGQLLIERLSVARGRRGEEPLDDDAVDWVMTPPAPEETDVPETKPAKSKSKSS